MNFFRQFVIPCFFALTFTYVFNSASGFVKDLDSANVWGKTQVLTGKTGSFSHPPYSVRFQAEALKRGELSIRKTPVNHFHDSTWVNGKLHQTWGLGLPILLVAADILTLAIFRDDFVADGSLVLGLIFVGLFIWGHVATSYWPQARLVSIGLFLIGALAFVHPSTIVLIKSGVLIYQLTVLTGFVWAFINLGIFLSLYRKFTWPKWLLFSFCIGFVPLIRPSMSIFACLIFAVAMVMVARSGQGFRRKICFGVAVAAVPFLFLLVTNNIRFGSPVRFGYETALALFDSDLYALRFESPVKRLPIWQLLKEMFANTFLGAEYRSWEAPVVRLREGFENPFSLYDLAVLVVIGGLGLGVYLGHGIGKRPIMKDLAVPACLSTAGILSFGFLFVFLSRHTSIAYRYIVELYPSALALCCGALFMMHAGDVSPKKAADQAGRRFGNWYTAACVFLLVIFLIGVGVRPYPKYANAAPRDYFSHATVRLAVDAERTNSQKLSEDIPVRYDCPTPRVPPETLDIKHLGFSLLGWRQSDSCKVTRLVLQAFLPFKECLSITLIDSDNVGNLQNVSEPIRAKAGNDHLVRTSKAWRGTDLRVTFCRDSPLTETRVELVTFAWAPLDAKGHAHHDAIYLRSIESDLAPGAVSSHGARPAKS